jgi:hypothetical protein
MAPLVTTARPSPEFRRHHDVAEPRVDGRAFRQAWIVRTRLDQLLAAGRITPAEFQAASEYRAAWAVLLRLGSTGDLGRVRAVPADPHRGALARVAAAERIVLVEAAIGSLARDLCRACIIHDLHWTDLARRCRRDPRTVRDWTTLAIRGLAGAWDGSTRRPAARPQPDSRQAADRPVAASQVP